MLDAPKMTRTGYMDNQQGRTQMSNANQPQEAQMAITYILDDKACFYHGRKVVMVRFGERNTRVVRVVGTSIEMVVHLRNLAAA